MTSGVKVSDDVFTRFSEMKMKKKARYMVMHINEDEGQIVHTLTAEKTADQKKDYEAFLSYLPKKASCYVFLDLTVPSPSGIGGKEKLFAIAWCPDTAEIKNKMLYASTKSALTDRIKEGIKVVQANDLTDMEYEELLSM